MIPRLLIAFAVCALTAAAGAQESRTALRLRLEVGSPVVSAGTRIDLMLVVSATETTVAPATLLGGQDLRTWLDNEESIRLRDLVEGDVRLAAGTEVRRTISIDTATLWSPEDLAGHSSLVLEWEGVPESRVKIRLVPDQSDLDLDQLDLAKTTVRLITNHGEMVVTFFPDKAPKHARNFIKLGKEGFYDGTRFHRIVRGFMIQGGDPYTKKGADGQIGTGGPGYRIDAEFNDVRHVRGILSMARSTDPDSAGSQFFVMHGDAPALDGSYTAFGRVESGLETLDEIADVPVRPTPRGEASVPVEDVWLYAVVVEPALR